MRSPAAKAMRAAGDGHDLVGEAADVDLDAALGCVVEGVVREPVEIEIGVELAVDPLEQVEVEGGGDAPRVVVGGLEDGRRPSSDRRRSASRRRAPEWRAVGQKIHRPRSGAKLPIVEPGKNPTRLPRGPGSGGSSNGRV